MEKIPRQIIEWSKYNDYTESTSNEDVVIGLLKFIHHESLLKYVPKILNSFNEMVNESDKNKQCHNNHKALIGTALGYLHKRNLLILDGSC